MSTALYRRYRPETFQDVIGQEHVTEPLMTALQNNRVNHAYLFSGPRGCGKTTSARILARCLNCAEGPTATPCGHCESCRDLARDGAGSLDVIEMDAASHGGVDHARDLRERATFAPVRDRYKIFIIDEAHMVTREGFNALLKIVEEPPEHIKFVFATTEPNKVLGTIRSRTHHYPFRLVAPEVLRGYLNHLCEEEGISVEQGVLPLVVRAGGGSVRDSLSVLDQLMGGSGPEGITYDLAVALLGFTHAELLDGVVDAFAAGDSPAVFQAVDRVIQTGQDPRRFVEDLLERFRDLIIVKAVPDSAAQILHGMPEDQIERMKGQAHQLGAAELSRAADITNQALTEMIGATSPQLHLELLCARILLPTADDSSRGVNARVDRLERRINLGSVGAVQAPLQSDPAAVMTPETPAEHVAAQVSEGAAPGGGREAALAMARRNRPAPTERQEASDEAPSAAQNSENPAAEHSGPESRGPEFGGAGSRNAEPRSASPDTASASGVSSPNAASRSRESADSASAPVPPRGPLRPDPAQDAEDARGQGQGPRPERDELARQDGSSEYHPQPTAAPDAGQVNLIGRSWADVVTAVGRHSKVAQATFRECRPARFENGVLYVQSGGPGIESRVERYAGALAAALQETLGITCRVAVDGSGPQDGPGGSGGSRGPSGPSGAPTGPASGGSPESARQDRGQSSGAFANAANGGSERSVQNSRASAPAEDDWPDDRQWEQAARRAEQSSSTAEAPARDRGPGSEPTARAPRPAEAPRTELPDGPRGGAEAWEQHGEPLASDAPAWSEDAEGESFTGWAVARIPGDDSAQDSAGPASAEGSAAAGTASDARSASASDAAQNRADSAPASHEPMTDTARLRVVSGQGDHSPQDPRAAASLTVVPPLGDTESAEPSGAEGATQQGDARSEDVPQPDSAPTVDAGAAEQETRAPAHDWAVAARQAGAPGAPVDGRDCGWGFSGPTSGTAGMDHPSRWGQRAPHLASVTNAPEPSASTAPEESAGTEQAAPEASERHLHAVPAEEHRPFHERYADQIAAGAAHGSPSARGPVDPTAPEPPEEDWDAFVPAPEDEDLEDSAVYGQAAVETILGGRVIDERPHHQQ